jgi:glucose-1-phosphate thymidylyltransferase
VVVFGAHFLFLEINMKTKGIILAGGKGTRMFPSTELISKQLLSVYDKPMIYYPVSTLMLSGIKDILIITTPNDVDNFKKILGNGSKWGIKIQYKEQIEARGIADAFIIGEEFIGNSQVCLILGDNLFYGKLDFLRKSIRNNSGGTIFGYEVNDPDRYGIVSFDKDGKAISIEEKPKKPKSNFAIPGLYIFTSDVVDIAKNVKPSKRGELEITDVQNSYLEQGRLNVEIMGRGMTWLDTGTPESLLEASQFMYILEKRQNLKIACLEEIALDMKYITIEEYKTTVGMMPNSPYKNYCTNIMNNL